MTGERIVNGESKAAGEDNVKIETRLSLGEEARERIKSTEVEDKDGNTLLHGACEISGLPTAVYMYAAAGLPINHVNKDGDTALHLSARRGNILVTEALLQCGADPFIRNKLGLTPVQVSSGKSVPLLQLFGKGLPQAVREGDFGSVVQLTKYWVSVSSNIYDGQNVFKRCQQLAISNPNVARCVQKLRDYKVQSCLIHAVLSDNTTQAETVLRSSKMCSVNSKYLGKRSLLSIAMEAGNVSMVKLLLEKGVRVDARIQARCEDGEILPCTLLPYSQPCNIEVAKLLSDCKINTKYARDCNGNTALMRCILNEASNEFIKWHIEDMCGETLGARNTDCLTALDIAKRKGCTHICHVINEYIHQNINTLGTGLMSQFYGDSHPDLSAQYKTVEKLALKLFEAVEGDNVQGVIKYNTMNYQDKNGWTGLHRAVAFCRVNVIKELIQTRPALKGICDNHGRYPLHIAFLLPANQREDIIKLLLQSNAQSYEYATDKDGVHPAEYTSLPSDEQMGILTQIKLSSQNVA